MKHKKNNKQKRFMNPENINPIRISDDRYKKLRRTRNEKTKSFEWGWFVFKEVVQVTDRERQIEVPRSQRPKGVWVAEFPKGPEGRPTVYITCPHCATIMKVTDHEIKADGELNPCVVCPGDKCREHCFMRLKGWTHGTIKSIGGWGFGDYVSPGSYTPYDRESAYGFRYGSGFGSTFSSDDAPVDPLADPLVPPTDPGRSSVDLPASPMSVEKEEERRRWWKIW
jgi:hypothetical protein